MDDTVHAPQWWRVVASAALGDEDVLQVQQGEDGTYCLKVEIDNTSQIIPVTPNQAASLILAVNRIADGVTVTITPYTRRRRGEKHD